MEAQDLKRVLRTALIYSFSMHGYDRDEAELLASIALAPVAQTLEFAMKVLEVKTELAAEAAAVVNAVYVRGALPNAAREASEHASDRAAVVGWLQQKEEDFKK